MGHLSKHVIRADVNHGRTDLCTGLGHMPHGLAVHAMRLRFRMFCSIHSGERRRVNHHVGTVAVQGLDHSSCIAHIEVALAEPHHLHLGSRNRALEQPCAELACGAGHQDLHVGVFHGPDKHGPEGLLFHTGETIFAVQAL